MTLCNLVTVFAETKSVTKSRLHCTKLNSNLIYLTKSWKKTVQNHSSNWFTVRFLDKCSKIEVFLALKSRIHHRNRHYNLSGLRLLVKPNWTLDEGCIAFIPANVKMFLKPVFLKPVCQPTTVLELGLSVALFELNRTIWQDFFAFLWFFLPRATFLVTSYILLSWNIENLLLNHHILTTCVA